MRRLTALFVSMVCFCTFLFAQNDRIKLPDFAYPQDVVKTAEELIKSSAGGERVLGALELLTAETSIDYQSLPRIMKLLQNLADSTEERASKSLLKLLAAQTGYSFYRNDSLVVDYYDQEFNYYDAKNRLRSTTDSLLIEALTFAPSVPLDTYLQALEYDEIGLSVMPTVRDFMAWHIVYPTDLLNPKREFIDIALEATDLTSPIHKALQAKFKLPAEKKDRYEFMLDMLDNHEGDYALYLFIESLDSRAHLSNSQIKDELEFLRNAKQKVAGSWVEETVDTRIGLLEAPYYSVEFPRDVFSSDSVTITLTGYNTDQLTLNLHRFKSERKALDAWKSGALNEKPYISKIYNFKNSLTGDKRSETFTLDAGHYIIDVEGNISKEYASNGPIFNVFPWSIIAFDYNHSDQSVILQAVDSKTSEPIPGLQVVIDKDDKLTPLNLYTDKNGCVRVSNVSKKYDVGLKDGVTGNIFNTGLPIQATPEEDSSDDDDKESLYYELATDLPAYLPGDTVEMVIVAYNDENTMPGMLINATISFPENRNRERQRTDIAFGPTDDYGRATARVTIPKDTPLGTASVSVSDSATDAYIGSFLVSKQLFVKNIEFSAVESSVTPDSIIITGRIENPDGMGIAGINIEGTVEYNKMDVPEDIFKPFPLSVVTNSRGKFRLSAPRYTTPGGSDNYDEKFATIHLEATSSEKRKAFLCIQIDMAHPFYIYFPSIFKSKYESIPNTTVKTFYDKSRDIEFEVAVRGSNPPDEIVWTLRNKSYETKSITGKDKIGKIVIPASRLKDLPTGKYSLRAELPDGSAIPSEYFLGINLFDPADTDVPTNKSFIIADYIIEGESGCITIGIKDDNTTIWLDATNLDDKDSQPEHLYHYKLNRGWHRIPIEIGRLPKFRSGVELEVYTLNSEHKLDKEEILVIQLPTDSLSLTCTSFRDNLIPGSRETWTFETKKNGQPVEAALILNLVDAKFDDLRWLRPFEIKPYRELNSIIKMASKKDETPSWFELTSYNPRMSKYNITPKIGLPDWRVFFTQDKKEDYQKSFFDRLKDFGMTNYRPKIGYAVMKSKNPPSHPMSIPVTTNNDKSETQASFYALWKPLLTTDKNGCATISFDVPSQSMTWYLRAQTWTKDLLSTSITKYFSASKPLVVSSTLPENIHPDTTVNLGSTVSNITDSVMEVTLQISVEDGTEVLTNINTDITLAPGENRSIITPVTVCMKNGALIYTIRASNGDYCDGERRAISITSD
ncbi:MAG: hypothetical protein HDT07_02810 [Bacteroidales bacterium]|nr:hypothetical protein [Bacteroidales bacterium]